MLRRWAACLVVWRCSARFVGFPSTCAGGFPCGPGHETCGPPHAPASLIHLQDPTCDMNDPNAPFQDRNGVHHVFFQKRICIANDGMGQGPVWGHAVSRDLAHWEFLPVAVWNGPDVNSAKAVYTGSATLAGDEGPVLMYAGRGANAFGVATPANASDPLLRDWDKRDVDVVDGTDDDPSTAWRGPTGEWRTVAKGGNPKGAPGASIYASDGPAFLSKWQRLGSSNLPMGECPSLFPNPGAGPGDPTHVHMYGNFNAYYHLGFWEDDPASSTGLVGRWNTTTGAPPVVCERNNHADAVECRRLDRGAGYYAPKDYLTSDGRRVVWGWLKGAAHGALSLPRELRYDRHLGVLTSTPVDELKALRSATLASAPGKPVPLKLEWASGAAVEILVRWGSPARRHNARHEGPRSDCESAGCAPSELQEGASLTLSVGGVGDATVACDAAGCATRIFGVSDRFDWRRDDDHLSLRVYVDPVAVETFAQGGRVASTSPRRGGSTLGLALSATAKNATFAKSAAASVRVFALDSIYATPSEQGEGP